MDLAHNVYLRLKLKKNFIILKFKKCVFFRMILFNTFPTVLYILRLFKLIFENEKHLKSYTNTYSSRWMMIPSENMCVF